MTTMTKQKKRELIKKLTASEEDAIAKCKWTPLGLAAMDTAQLVISDPCYCVNADPNQREFTYGFKDAEPNVDAACLSDQQEFKQLHFRRGHAGAGVTVHCPHGDGAVTIWGKLDAKGRIRAVFFSFDGEQPE